MEAALHDRFRANIRKLYAFSASWLALIIIPVMIPYFQSRGLSIAQIYALQAYYAALILLLDVPSGYIADLFTRKACLIVGSFLGGIAYTVLYFSTDAYGLILFETVCALGNGLISGADVSMLYESAEAVPGAQKAHVLSRRLSYLLLSEGLAALLGGWLASHALQWAALAQALVAWVPFGIAWTLMEPPRKKLERKSHWQNILVIKRSILNHSKLLTRVLVLYVILGTGTLLAVWAHQGNWQRLGIPLVVFGYLWAAYNLLGALIARMAPAIERVLGPAVTLVGTAILPVVGFIGIGLENPWLSAALGALFPVCRGLNQVILTDALNARVPSSLRATANSTAALGVRALFGLLGPAVGHGIDRVGYKATFGWLALAWGVGGALMVGLILRQRAFFRLTGTPA